MSSTITRLLPLQHVWLLSTGYTALFMITWVSMYHVHVGWRWVGGCGLSRQQISVLEKDKYSCFVARFSQHLLDSNPHREVG